MENPIMKTLLSTAAVLALLAAVPAFAAENPAPANPATAATDQNKTDMLKKPAAGADQGAAATDQTDQDKAAAAPAALS
jgi:hypothetical protein